jgi:hypothetical protein
MVARMAKPPAEASRRYDTSSETILRSRGSGHKKLYDRPKTLHSRKTTVRTTMNSASTTRNVIRLPASATIPTPPSRSPSPPAEVVTRTQNNKTYMYTESDRTFFFKCIQWELKCDMTLGKQALCKKLAEKV